MQGQAPSRRGRRGLAIDGKNSEHGSRENNSGEYLSSNEIPSEAPPQTDEPVVSYDIPVNVIVIVIVDVHDHG